MYAKILIPTVCILATIACQPAPSADNNQNFVPGVFVSVDTFHKLENALQNPSQSNQIEKSNVPSPQEANKDEQTLGFNSNSNTNLLSNDPRVNYNQNRYPMYTNEQQDSVNQPLSLNQQLPLVNQQLLPATNQQLPVSSQQTDLQNSPSLLNQQQFLKQNLNPQNYIPNEQPMLLNQQPQVTQAIEVQQPVNQQLQSNRPILVQQPINQQVLPNQPVLVQQPGNQQLQSNLPVLLRQPINQQILPNQPAFIQQPVIQQLQPNLPALVQQPVNQQILPNQAILIPQPSNQQTLLIPQQQIQPLVIENGQLVGQYNSLNNAVLPNGGSTNQLYAIVPLNGQNVPSSNLVNNNAYLIPVQQLSNNPVILRNSKK